LAAREGSEIVGILTLNETFAIYANGNYGVIDEMYVIPSRRSTGIGKELVEAAKELGLQRGWSRIDVTAPESERWERTRRFYEKEGFAFTGPKLKYLL
jgi:GNAT superfamily N-acetyltransferase